MGVDCNGQLGSGGRLNPMNGTVAQLVEHRTEDASVGGSNPPRSTN
jgi:hypothetical protein